MYQGKVSYFWSACGWQSSEGLLQLYDESLLIFVSNVNFSYSSPLSQYLWSVLPPYSPFLPRRSLIWGYTEYCTILCHTALLELPPEKPHPLYNKKKPHTLF